MKTLPEGPGPVNSKAADATPQDPDTSDRAWLASEAADWLAKADPTAYDLDGFVSWALASLVRGMVFHRTLSARDYARVLRADLDAVGVDLLHRPSKLAEDLEVQASWYLALDTDAGRLAAFELSRYADQADRMRSQTVEEWVLDEAAWQAAALDSVCGLN